LSERKSFLIRVDPKVLEALQRWAGDDLRSLNGQIEYVLRRSLERAGRLGPRAPAPKEEEGEGGS
jgi:hypothetical protein